MAPFRSRKVRPRSRGAGLHGQHQNGTAPVERDGKIVPAGSQIPFTVTQVNSDTELILNKIFICPMCQA